MNGCLEHTIQDCIKMERIIRIKIIEEDMLCSVDDYVLLWKLILDLKNKTFCSTLVPVTN